MFYRHDYNTSSPIAYVGRIPIFAVTILVATFVAGAILARIGLSLNPWSWMFWPTDGSRLHEALGGLLLYIVSSVSAPITAWWVFDMVFLYIFGKELEQHLGHSRFIAFYLCLYFITPLLCFGLFWTVSNLSISFYLFGPANLLFGFFGASNPANLAIFIAFAAVYPNAQLLLGVPAKFWAWGLLVFQLFNWQSIYTLGAPGIFLPLNALGIGAVCTFLFAWFMMRGRYQLNAAIEWIPRPALIRRRFRKARSADHNATATRDPHSIIDPLLEKISHGGLSSLSYAERKRLDRARSELLKRTSKDP